MSKRYPVNKLTGKLVKREKGPWPQRPAEAPPPHAEGSLDWTANMVFGSRESLLEQLESLGEEWRYFCVVFRQWQRDARQQGLAEPTLNELGVALKIPPQDFWQKVFNSVAALRKTQALLQAALASPQVIATAVAAAQDLEKGGKDREMLLKIAGVLEGGQGVTVNVQQNNFQGRDAERAKTPLLQFSETVTELDELGRDVIEGEIVEGETDGSDNTAG